MPLSPATREFFNLIERNFHFDHEMGESTMVSYPYTTAPAPWRVLPTLVVCHFDFAARVDRKEHPVVYSRAGQTISINPGVPHRMTKITRGSQYSHWSHIQCEIFSGVSLFYLVEPPVIIKGRRSEKIAQLNHEFGEIDRRERTLPSLLRRQILGWELVWNLLDSVPFNDERIDFLRYASRLAPVLSYIKENLAQPIDHPLLARIAGFSPSRFHFLFRSALGCAPYQYVQNLRLKKAQELLIRTELSIAQVGENVGHSDPLHFSKIFRCKVGLSPAKYRTQVVAQSFGRG